MEFPGCIVIERLDMRIGDAHLIIGEEAYAVGRYMTNGAVGWVWAHLVIPAAGPHSVAIEFSSKEVLEWRLQLLKGKGQSLASADNSIVTGSPIGCVFKDVGISIGYQCSINLYGTAAGSRPIEGVRDAVWNQPTHLGEYLGTGGIARRPTALHT